MTQAHLPQVTVIVPCYNHQAYVRDCIHSILNQTYPNIQLIVLDDGSSDDSPKILSELAGQHGFHYEHQQNMGLCRTLNKGISLATGKYICTLASDDMMFLDRLEKQVSALEARQDLAVCAGNMINISDSSEVLSKQRIRPRREVDFDDLFWRNVAGPAAPTAMIRKSVLDKVGGYDPDIRIEDLYMWLKITAAGHKVLILNDLVAYYRKHDSNTHSNYRMMLEHETKIISAYSDHPKFETVRKRLLLSTFVKTADRDKKLARELLKEISFWDSPAKVGKGFFRLLFG